MESAATRAAPDRFAQLTFGGFRDFRRKLPSPGREIGGGAEVQEWLNKANKIQKNVRPAVGGKTASSQHKRGQGTGAGAQEHVLAGILPDGLLLIGSSPTIFLADNVLVAYEDLREWIKALERAGELKRVREEVDPVLEMAEITDRASKSGTRGAGKGASPAGRRCCLRT